MAIHKIDWIGVGQKVVEQMDDLCMTREDVATKAGVSDLTVRRIMDGWSVQMESLLSIADVLNLTPDYLLGYWDEKEQKR